MLSNTIFFKVIDLHATNQNASLITDVFETKIYFQNAKYMKTTYLFN